MTVHDPRIDPQPGDEIRGGHQVRQVIRREGERILIQSLATRYWMRVDRWREWCESGAEGAKAANQEE